ncbi:DUF6268 family outer membrane beta-barrel protein [Pendulispora brunnea]|uniref:DUF6268 family outer membrane beta-barrel protein n=1 Tax=Pendulispora brunnea TaxID=2905690 RepID=A0ABZ2KKP5_9BACT
MADSLASVSYEHYPNVDSPRDSGSTIGLEVFRFRAGLPIPLTESKKTILLPGLSYELLGFHGEGANKPNIGTLHAPSASLGLLQVFGDRFIGMAMVGAGFASDFRDPVSADDLLFTVTGMFLYKFDKNFTLGAGVTYDRRSGNLLPLPAIGVNWQINNEFRIRGFIPARLDVEYRALPWLTVGLRGTFEGNRFHLSEKQYGASDLQLAYSIITVGPKVTFRLADMMHLDVYSSVAVMRRYEALRDGDSLGSAYLHPTVLSGIRLWFGPSGWRTDQDPAPIPPKEGESK